MDWGNVNRFRRRDPAARDEHRDRRRRRGRDARGSPRKRARSFAPAAEEDGQGAARWGQIRSRLIPAGGLAGIAPRFRGRAARDRSAPAGQPQSHVKLQVGPAEAEAITGMARLPEGGAATGPAGSSAATRLRASVRSAAAFVAAYPITPATEMFEWDGAGAGCVGVIAVANTRTAGVGEHGHRCGPRRRAPSLTATAGPGLALMTEVIGLRRRLRGAGIVVVDDARRAVDRHPGPRANRATWSFAVERPARRRAALVLGADLDRRLRGDHRSGRCTWPSAARRRRSCCLDQFMGQSRAIIDRPADRRPAAQRADRRRQRAGPQALPRHATQASRRYDSPARLA